MVPQCVEDAEHRVAAEGAGVDKRLVRWRWTGKDASTHDHVRIAQDCHRCLESADAAIPVHGNPLATAFSSLALWTR